VDPPVACSLEAADARAQLDRWSRLLGAEGVRTSRPAPTALVVALAPDVDVAEVARLAQVEALCCPFFTFALELRAEGATLSVTVPDDAVPVLDGFAGLAG
jgi:hypothetical protein